MGNCLKGHAVRHVSGSSTVSSASHLATPKPAESRRGHGENREKLPYHTQSGMPPGSMAADGSTHCLHAFTYAELKAATRNFRPDSFLGEGGFGSVFKGIIDERTFLPVRAGQGILIAVKKLNLEGVQGDREWLTELKYLGTLKHPNLVKLIGYCYEDDNRLLVYEFLTRGSLENQLFGRNHHRSIAWSVRLKIAVDAARGLSFLHNAEKPVIYRDFKSSNILLDSDFNAKLSDFGLAKDGPTGDKTHVTTRVLGTYGYAAPEYVSTGRLTAKSDVYGFGVVLLEILTGRRAVEPDTIIGERNLVEWAMPYLTDKRRWSRVLDQKLDGQYSLKGAQQAASISLQCLSEDPKKRPTMKVVLESLELLLNPRDPPNRSSSSRPPASPMRSPIRESSRIELPHSKQNKHIHVAKQQQTIVSHLKPANVLESLELLLNSRDPPNRSSSSRPPASPMRSPIRESSRIELPHSKQNKHIHVAKQEHTIVSHLKPANAFRLPSPQQIACKETAMQTILPFQSPGRLSPKVYP